MKEKRDKVLSGLGIAAKAGAVKSGEFQTEHAVKTGSAFLVIIAGDASENTKNKFKSMCEFYEVPCALYGDRDVLGRCIGKDFRSSLAVTVEKLAGMLEIELLREEKTEVAE